MAHIEQGITPAPHVGNADILLQLRSELSENTPGLTNSPSVRANPYPEVTDLFCRLPLPTLFYWPEAFHLGDLLRIWVRICTKFTHLSPNSFKGQCKRIGWHKTCATFSGRSPYLRANRFQGTHFTINEPLNKKRQLSPKLALT